MSPHTILLPRQISDNYDVLMPRSKYEDSSLPIQVPYVKKTETRKMLSCNGPAPVAQALFVVRKTHTVWLVEEVTPGRPDANFGEKTFFAFPISPVVVGSS